MRERSIPHLSESAVAAILTPKVAVAAVRRAFVAMGRGEAQMPPKTYVENNRGDFRAMPALSGDGGKAIAGVKWVSVFPQNPSQNRPTVQATYLLSSAETGELTAILDAGFLTGMRTGAAGAIASEALWAPKAPTSQKVIVALIGSGKQAEFQALCHQEVFLGRCFFKVWSHDAEGLARFVSAMNHRDIGVFTAARNLDEAVADADIVCTCTTATGPVLGLQALKKDLVHINAIGADAPGKQELESAVLSAATVVVDDLIQAAHSGEINVPIAKGEYSESRIAANLGHFLTSGDVRARVNEARKALKDTTGRDLTVFDSTGLAVQDLFAAAATLNIT